MFGRFRVLIVYKYVRGIYLVSIGFERSYEDSVKSTV